MRWCRGSDLAESDVLEQASFIGLKLMAFGVVPLSGIVQRCLTEAMLHADTGLQLDR